MYSRKDKELLIFSTFLVSFSLNWVFKELIYLFFIFKLHVIKFLICLIFLKLFLIFFSFSFLIMANYVSFSLSFNLCLPTGLSISSLFSKCQHFGFTHLFIIFLLCILLISAPIVTVLLLFLNLLYYF